MTIARPRNFSIMGFAKKVLRRPMRWVVLTAQLEMMTNRKLVDLRANSNRGMPDAVVPDDAALH